jgi:hypothetical protein
MVNWITAMVIFFLVCISSGRTCISDKIFSNKIKFMNICVLIVIKLNVIFYTRVVDFFTEVVNHML